MRLSKGKWFSLGCVVVLIGFGVWLYPFREVLWLYVTELFRGKKQFNPEGCMQNLKSVGQALNLYLQANDAYPPADRWMDELILYLHADDITRESQKRKLACPEVGDGESTFGYAFNGEISSLWSDEVENPADTPALYDSEKLDWNAFDEKALDSLPKKERESGNNAVYADGHAAPVKRK
ncbi:MAG: hypothetical protein AB1725_06645 [Armatimonadota bacterium]